MAQGSARSQFIASLQVLEYPTFVDFPASGVSGVLYISGDDSKLYRWDGASYELIYNGLLLGETSGDAYRGDRGKTAYDHSQATGNPHGLTKADLSLNNVPNVDATNPSNITQDSTHRFATDSEKSDWDSKQEALTFDASPVESSTNPVHSGGVYTALSNKSDVVHTHSISDITSLSDTLDDKLGVGSTTADISDSTDKRYVTDANLTALSLISGTNTGDETEESIKTKLGAAESGIDGYLLGDDWDIFNDKQDAIGYTAEDSANKENTTIDTSTTKYPTVNLLKSGLDGKLSTSLKGAANGLAELDAGGKVPSGQLPSYVDDVLEYANFAALPVTGDSGVIYITLSDNITYRWSGSAYVEISSSLALGESSGSAYRGDRGKTAYDHSQVTTGNPHSVTKTDVGLGNVLNVDTTSPANISQTSSYRFVTDAEKSSWDGKQSALSGTGFVTISGTTISYDNNSYTLDNNTVSGATKTKLTYDSKGRITAGADATTADIADSADKRYITDAQATVISNTSGTNTGDNATNTQYSGLSASKQDTISVTTAKLLGRASAGTGAFEEITLGTNLSFTGTTLNAAGGGGGTPGGSTTQIQYNNAGAFGGSANLVWDNANNRLGLVNSSPTSRFQLDYNQNSVTQSDANGILLANNAAATVGLQSISPPLIFKGNGWKTTATAESRDVRFKIDVLPVQGTTNPTANLQISSSVNGAAYVKHFDVESGTGNIKLGAGNITGQNILPVATQIKKGASTTASTYRITNTDVNVTPALAVGSPETNTAGSLALAYDVTNGLVFNAANGTRHIARASIGITNLVDTAASESADLIFSTHPAGIGIGLVERLRISSTGIITSKGEISVPNEAYGVGWGGNNTVPTKNAIYDKIETLVGGGVSESLSIAYAIALG